MTITPRDMLIAIELHDPERIVAAIRAGVGANQPIEGRPPLHWLTEMYTRSPRFTACVRALLDAGADLPDDLLRAVLLDDAATVESLARRDAGCLGRRVSLRCAFTPLVDATMLHVAAEFSRTDAARALISLGADVDARAGLDADGLNGHTPLFHTVNAHANHARPVMDMLLDAGARVDVALPGLTWGVGFEWETVFFDVTPLAYAQLGLLPQVHRDEKDIADNIARLLRAAGRPTPTFRNVPNRYLQR